MATGDILSCAINADGRSATAVVEGVNTGGTYLWDASNTSLVLTASAKVVFTVVSKSFDSSGSATTISRTVYGTLTQRQPGSASLNETYSGGNCTIVFGLSEPIYAKDKSGGGNSGTDPTVAFSANWYTQGGHASNAGTPSVTNNSALAYYVPFGQWDMLNADVYDSDFRVGFVARHLHGIAAVKFTCTGGVSSHAETATTATETKRQRPVTLLYGTCHEATITLSGYTQGEQINHVALVYPLVGDTALDTSTTSNYEVASDGAWYGFCNKSGTLWQYGTVISTGDDGTGVVSGTLATADATPFATIKGAIDAGATMVYLKDTANNFASRSTSKTTAYWITVMPHPTNSSTTTVTALGAAPATACNRLRFKNVTRAVEASSGPFMGGSGRYIANENVTFSTSKNLGENDWNFDGIYYKDCTFADASKWKIANFSTDRFRYWMDGCVLTTAGKISAFYRMIGCSVTGAYMEQSATEGNTPANLLIEFNELMSMTGSSIIEMGRYATATGNSLIGNVIEGVSVTPSAMLSIAEGYAFDYDHFLLAHNTIVGERENVFYNDSGTTAYYRRGVRMHANIFEYFASKGDLFGTPSANRIGNWWVVWGTCNRDNFCKQTQLFPLDYIGLNFTENTDPLFVDDNSDSGGGDGDYSLQAGSPALGYLSAGGALVPYDLFGTQVKNDGTGAIGAIQPTGSALLLLDQDMSGGFS